MKILAFTDLHLSNIAVKKLKKKIKKNNPDILVCAGDISIFEEGLDIMLNKLSKLKKKIIIINGNHEEDNVMKKLCKAYSNIIYIHKKHYVEQNVLFLGYGGSGFSTIEPEFYNTGEKFASIIKENKDKKVVLITHAPPYKTTVDLIVDQHCGNKTLRNFISRHRIDITICGHLHENFGRKDKIKKTEIINPGPYGKILTI